MSNEKINILLVDDRPENLLALEAIIEKDEYQLIKAYSGEEALKYLLKYDFAAILLDVQMPGIDGLGTAKIIKAREKTKNIPILFITANNMDSDHIFAGYSIGAIDYLLKPFDPIILKAKVEGFVELYKMNQKLIVQAESLAEKKKELEKVNKELTKKTSDLIISEALANIISETSIDSMIILDIDGNILKVNPAVKKMFQYKEEELVTKNISLFFSCETSTNFITKLLESLNNNLESIIGLEHVKEISATRKDGSLFPAEIQIGKRYVQDKSIVAFTIRDITRNKKNQEIITHMAYHDGLTNLPNRRLFNEQLVSLLNQAKQNNQPLALLYLDMDRFKYINDSLGHLIGDKVLQEIAVKLQSSLRTEDFVSRVGGDEFNIILPNSNRENALEMAEKILEVCKVPIYVDNYELFVTACIGISIFPYDGEDPTLLVKNADAALYRAKEQGKNQYNVYHSGLNIQTYRNFIMQNDLRRALELDQFKLVYQPRIDLATESVRSAEALIRWEHPNWGTIPPSEFIPLAEETGLIIEIGQWVLNAVCNQIKLWKKANLSPIRIAVNLSSQQFHQKDLIENIQHLLTEMDVSPSLIEIEVTESSILGNETVVTNTLNQLRSMGIWLSIDDFGTGYSSLNYLRKFPFDTLKIDKSFIQDISHSSDSNALVSTIISLSKCLHMKVIAEGVETEEQLNILRELKCHEIQGYLFSPPISAKDFESFLLNSQTIEVVYENKNDILIENRVLLYSDLEESAKGTSVTDQNQEILYSALQRIGKIYSISNREMDVFKLIVNGLSNKEISDQLFISEHTVKNHITHIFQKLTVNDRLQAMAKVYKACIEEGKIIRAQL